MIPLHDTIPSRRLPLVNYALIAITSATFVAELRAPDLEHTLLTWGLVPAHFRALSERAGFAQVALWTPLLTSAFLHAGWAHFLGNMLYLWIFGDNVEDRFGHVGYALFYLAGAVAAGVAHLATNPTSIVPTIGASGAIAAVMGAYFLLYPRARIATALLVLFAVRVVYVPAFTYLAFWFVFQLLAGAAALATTGPGEGGVAWWAHLGGFAFGAATVLLLGRRARVTGSR